MLWLIIVAAVSILADQLTKWWAVTALKPVWDIPIWEGVLHFTYAENTGAAFSMLQGGKWIFVVISSLAAVLIFLAAWKYRREINLFGFISVGLLLGGNIGNLIDRLRLSYVVDFIYVKAINFPVFNVADSCITIGAIMLGIFILFMYGKEKNTLAGGDHAGLSD